MIADAGRWGDIAELEEYLLFIAVKVGYLGIFSDIKLSFPRAGGDPVVG